MRFIKCLFRGKKNPTLRNYWYNYILLTHQLSTANIQLRYTNTKLTLLQVPTGYCYYMILIKGSLLHYKHHKHYVILNI